MVCRNCGSGQSRHGNIDVGTTNAEIGQSVPGAGFLPDDNKTFDPMMAFISAKSLTYQEMADRREFQQRMAEQQQEQLFLEMSDAMKQIHIDELIAVANCDKMGVPGMTPQQAIVALQETLSREDFSFVDELYPGLREAVRKKYRDLIVDRLPVRIK